MNNHAIIDDLRALCRLEALVMIFGPSTPLSPVLFEHGVTIIAGSRVLDEAAVLNYIGQGATFQQVNGVRLPVFTRPDSSPFSKGK